MSVSDKFTALVNRLIESDSDPKLRRFATRVQERCEVLRAQGHAMESVDWLIDADRWVEAARIGLSAYLAKYKSQNSDEALMIRRIGNIVENCLRELESNQEDLLLRIVLDGYCFVANSDSHSYRSTQVRNAGIYVYTEPPPARLVVLLALDLIEGWFQGDRHYSESEITDLFEARFSKYLLLKVEDFALASGEWKCFYLAYDLRGQGLRRPAEFADLIEYQLGGRQVPALKELPIYAVLETLWKGFMCRLALTDAGLIFARFTQHALAGRTDLCRALDNPPDLELFKTIALAKYPPPPPRFTVEELKRMPKPWEPAPGDAFEPLYDASFPVYYGLAYLVLEGDENQVGSGAFSGQRNGLLGTAQPGVMELHTGLHTGDVHLTVLHCKSEPPLPEPLWTELVEASFTMPAGRGLQLIDWNGDVAASLALPAGTYRARYGIGRYRQSYSQCGDAANRDAQGELMERCCLALWPAETEQPDAVLREEHESAVQAHFSQLTLLESQGA
jgi:hypothetical protein